MLLIVEPSLELLLSFVFETVSHHVSLGGLYRTHCVNQAASDSQKSTCPGLENDAKLDLILFSNKTGQGSALLKGYWCGHFTELGSWGAEFGGSICLSLL